MKKSTFSEAQIVAILAEGDAGLLVAQILRKHVASRRMPASESAGDRFLNRSPGVDG